MMRLTFALTVSSLLFGQVLAAQVSAPLPTRLVDVHVHAWAAIPADSSLRGALRSAFNTYHLEMAVVSGPADAVLNARALALGRLLAGVVYGAGLDLPPLFELRSLFLSHRLSVFGEIDAAWRGEAPDTVLLDSYWTLSETLGVPAGVFTGFAPPGTQYQPCCSRYRTHLARPGRIEEVLARHPKLRVYLMQAGWPYRDETIALMHAYPHVYADLGNLAANPAIPRAEFYDYLAALMRAGLGERLMFGSGLSLEEWPARIGAIIAAIQEVPFLTDADRSNIFYGNAVRFFRGELQSVDTPRR